jgi:hypothetical protein
MGNVPQLARLRELVTAERWPEALALASKFRRLGNDSAVLQRAHNARLRPEFYRGLGQDPDALFSTGVDVLRERYGP